jgi:xanthine dehydrogenase accessory factor
MDPLLDRLAALAEGDEPPALCTLVRVDGSTPQEAGAKMLVLPPAFETVGTLGGGCVEAEVRRRVAEVLMEGAARVLPFRLDSDYGWDDGLICGGSMSVLIDPILPPACALFRRLRDEVAAGRPAALVTAVGGNGGAARVGEKWLLADGLPADPSGELAGAVTRALREGRPRLVEAGGGEYFVDPFLPAPTLLIAGAGHVGKALTEIGALLGFSVVVVDDREEFANRRRLPGAARVLAGPIGPTLSSFPIDANTYVVVVTRGHNHDEEALEAVIRSPARYVGMIGSRRKVRLIFDDLKERGVDPALLGRVHTPIGLDLGAETVPEIAVAIAAQLVQVRRARSDEDARRGGMPGVAP